MSDYSVLKRNSLGLYKHRENSVGGFGTCLLEKALPVSLQSGSTLLPATSGVANQCYPL